MLKDHPEDGEQRFFMDIRTAHAEFESLYEKALGEKKQPGTRLDLLQFLMEKSAFLQRDENSWMLSVIEVIRTTSLYFQPQIRTKILNEGWASYWHETLFLGDDRISGHEVDFATINARVTSLPRIGLNPYALGMRLFYYLEEQADKGRFSYDYQRLFSQHRRRDFNRATGKGRQFIFDVRENFCDTLFVNTFIDQEFVDRHKLFVVDKRLNREKMTWEYFVKSKKAHHYKGMISDSLYHPPSIKMNIDDHNTLVINHTFEGKPLFRDYIGGTLMGIEYLWGDQVTLYTYEPEPLKKVKDPGPQPPKDEGQREINWKRVKYSMKNRKMTRVLID
jgi:stage V sporulation protein R